LIVIGCLFANVLKLNIIDGNASNGNWLEGTSNDNWL
jgi:hypothetical protein